MKAYRVCLALPLALALAFAAYAEPMPAGFGPNPTLPKPTHDTLPTVNIAPAMGWRGNQTPTPAAGFAVSAYAQGLDHPRWLYVLPNGDLLVAETDAPKKPKDSAGIKGTIMKSIMQQAGASRGSANRITLLRGVGTDGKAQFSSTFLEGLNSPFGMALVGNDLYIADTDALLKFPYREGDTQITAKGVKLIDLPAGERNHHWTKNVVASPDGTKLYVSVGSNSNVAENGMEAEEGRAAIWEVDVKSGKARIYATGLRNPVGMDWEPNTNTLWTVVNERDELGDDLVPDYLTSVKDGAFYGWPYSYYGQHVDARVKPERPDRVAKAIAPNYALGSHTASLGLAFARGQLLPEQYRNGAFIGQHGSWNRRPKAGYKVIFIPFANGAPAGPPENILTGFLNEKENALGRPVGVIIGREGALYVADDVGNAIWRVTPQQ